MRGPHLLRGRGGAMVLALAISLGWAAGVPAIAAESSPVARTLQAVERDVERLERRLRRLETRGAGDPSSSARIARCREEHERLERRLEGWLARRDREPYRRNLDRFLRDLQTRLRRLDAELDLRLGPDRPAAGAAAGESPAAPAAKPGRRRSGPAPAARLTSQGIPSNDACLGATPIGDGTFGGDTGEATNDGEATCGMSADSPDVWFRYAAGAAGHVVFTTFGSSFDTVLSLHSGCPGTSANELACNDDAVGVSSEIEIELAAGEEVLVRVAGYAGDHGPYVLAAGLAPAIGGTVTDAVTGQGIAGVTLIVYDEAGDWVSDDQTSAAGGYAVEGLSPGIHRLEARHPEYMPELWDDIACSGWCDPLAGTPIDLVLGETAVADFVLRRGGAIEGAVTDAQSGTAVAGIRVDVHDQDGGWIDSADSDSAGAYRLGGLAAGTYFLRAWSGEGYLGELFDDIACPGYCDPTTGTPIAIGLDETARADFALQLGGSIRGRVTDSLTGQPVTEGWVQLWDADLDWAGFEFVDDAGWWSEGGLAGGAYFARATGAGYRPELYDELPCPPGCNPGAGTPIAVTVGSETAGIDFTLDRESAFSGIVVDDPSGVPLTDFDVDAWDAQGLWVGSGWGGDWGNYAVGHLGPGTYYATTLSYTGHLDELYDDLPCYLGDCSPTAGTPIEVALAMNTPGIDFALDRGGTITGTVTDVASGAGLRGPLRLWDGAGVEVDAFAYADDGSYVVGGLPTGDYFLATIVAGDYLNELYDDIPCLPGCSPAGGTPVAVSAGAEAGGVDFALCGPPSLVARFPPSHDPDSFIDGCRVQIAGEVSPYHPGCPAVDRVFWDWGDGKQTDSWLPASHLYAPGDGFETISVTAYDLYGLASPTITKQVYLWDCLTPGACGAPDVRHLFNLSFDSTELIEACSTIELGPGVDVESPADLTFRAGESVRLDGVRILGGRVEIETDPALLP